MLSIFKVFMRNATFQLICHAQYCKKEELQSYETIFYRLILISHLLPVECPKSNIIVIWSSHIEIIS